MAQTVRDLYSLLSKRTDGVCNFITGGGCVHHGERRACSFLARAALASLLSG